MRAGIAFVLGALLAFAGCEGRRAGTEVGNPEIKVSAQSIVFDLEDSMEISSLPLRMMGMDYVLAVNDSAFDSGACWKRPGGTLVDLAADSIALPDEFVGNGEWSRAEIVMRTPDGPDGLPDAVDYRSWDNPRYIKFNHIRGPERDTLPALFEWPQNTQFRFRYGRESMESWHWKDEIWVPLRFFAYDWAAMLDSANRSWTYRKDGTGARYLLLSPRENADTWILMKNHLRDCFLADSVIIE